jgi:hypothetical protein
MTKRDYLLEQHYKNIAARPQLKDEETLTRYDRNIYYYNRDEVNRQKEATPIKVTYEDHRRVVETAINMMRKDTQHDIAMCILTHRFFANYRASVFAGEGSFNEDYGFLIKKIDMLFNPTTSKVKPINTRSKLAEFTTPTLVQVNHVVGTVTKVNVPHNVKTLNEWATTFNASANSTCTYQIAGLQLGA